MLTEYKVRHMKGWLKEPWGGGRERGSLECVKSQVSVCSQHVHYHVKYAHLSHVAMAKISCGLSRTLIVCTEGPP